MEGDGNEILRLPEELLALILSRTSPPDAGRCAAVSRAFLAAADSDAVWSCFLPRDLPRLVEGVLPHAPLSKKGLFRCLSDQPTLLPGNLVVRIELQIPCKCNRPTPTTLGACFLFYSIKIQNSTLVLCRACGWTKRQAPYPYPCICDSFREAAQLRGVWWLLIHGEIHSTMLSPNSKYAAYMVFKLADEFIKLDFPFQEASISVGGNDYSTRQVCLQAYMEDGDDGVPRKHILRCSWEDYMPHTNCDAIPLTDDVMLPRKRADGWMEVELGEFYNGEGCGSEVSVCLKETKGGVWKTGLIVWGIEIRTKQ
ncbi:hypothetical protein VPH35_113485 [Triticum aestivum]